MPPWTRKNGGYAFRGCSTTRAAATCKPIISKSPDACEAGRLRFGVVDGRSAPEAPVAQLGLLVAGRGHPGGHADTLFRIFDARKRLRSGFEAAVAISEDHYHATSGHFRAPPRVSYSPAPPDSNVTSWGVYVRRKVVLSRTRYGTCPPRPHI